MPGIGGRALIGVTCALLAGLSLSGCFVWNSAKWSPQTPKAGKTVNAVIKAVPVVGSNPPPQKNYPAVLIAFSSNGPRLKLGNKRTFDTKGDFGGPYKMFEDGALKNAVLDSDACTWGGEHLNQIPDVDWTAVRTDVEVSDRDKLNPAVVKVALKTDSTAVHGEQDAVYLIASLEGQGDPDVRGFWIRDGKISDAELAVE